MKFSDEALLFLWTSPASADFGVVSSEEYGKHIQETTELPENVRQALTSEKSAQVIQDLILRKHKLSLEQAQTVARIVGTILRGAESAANLRTLLSQRLDVTPPVLEDVNHTLTERFISPNYFQISQVYEKKHGTRATGNRGGTLDGGQWAPHSAQ